MEAVSKGSRVVWTKLLTPLALPPTWRAAGCSQHRPSAIKRPRLFQIIFCCFHQNPPAITANGAVPALRETGSKDQPETSSLPARRGCFPSCALSTSHC